MRRAGVAGIQKKKAEREKMSELGAQLKAEKISEVADHLELLESRLRDVAQKHQKQIKTDPVVRARFKQLAGTLGIDLIDSQTNVFAKALGLGDYYYNLGVKVIEICMQERRFHGPLVPMETVLKVVNKRHNKEGANKDKSASTVLATISGSSSDLVSEEDVRYALDKVKILGNGYEVVVTGDNVTYIQAAGELSTDSLSIITFAKKQKSQRIGTKGFEMLSAIPAEAFPVTRDEVMAGLRWSQTRSDGALTQLLQDGTAWIELGDSSSGSATVYWILLQ